MLGEHEYDTVASADAERRVESPSSYHRDDAHLVRKRILIRAVVSLFDRVSITGNERHFPERLSVFMATL